MKVGVTGEEWRRALDAFMWFRMESLIVRRVISFYVPTVRVISLTDRQPVKDSG